MKHILTTMSHTQFSFNHPVLDSTACIDVMSAKRKRYYNTTLLAVVQ